jgi:hypothetical protein
VSNEDDAPITPVKIEDASDVGVKSKSAAKTIVERLATFASITALIVSFIGALGYPAAVFQFKTLHIPTEFLTQGRFLRAGIIPAVVLLLSAVILYFTGRLLVPIARRIKLQFAGKGKTKDLSTAWGCALAPVVLPFFIWFVGFWLGAVFTFIWWPIVGLKSFAQKFGTLWAVVLTIAFLAISAIVQIRFWKKARPAARRRRDKRESSRAAGGDVEVTFEEVPFQGLYAAVMFGGWHLGVCYTLRHAFQTWKIDVRFLTSDTSWMSSLVVALVIGAMFYVAFSLPAFASINRSKRRIAWLELSIYVLAAYLVAVFSYSRSYYWKTPKFLGGGKPEPVSIWIDGSETNINLKILLPKASCIRTNDRWLCQTVYLLDATGEYFILVDDHEPGVHSLLISKSKISVISKSEPQ